MDKDCQGLRFICKYLKLQIFFHFKLIFQNPLVISLCFQNAGAFYESWGAGLSSVKIKGFKGGILDLSSSNWTYKVYSIAQD